LEIIFGVRIVRWWAQDWGLSAERCNWPDTPTVGR
jgi:hypothetical protein